MKVTLYIAAMPEDQSKNRILIYMAQLTIAHVTLLEQTEVAAVQK